MFICTCMAASEEEQDRWRLRGRGLGPGGPAAMERKAPPLTLALGSWALPPIMPVGSITNTQKWNAQKNRSQCNHLEPVALRGLGKRCPEKPHQTLFIAKTRCTKTKRMQQCTRNTTMHTQKKSKSMSITFCFVIWVIWVGHVCKHTHWDKQINSISRTHEVHQLNTSSNRRNIYQLTAYQVTSSLTTDVTASQHALLPYCTRTSLYIDTYIYQDIYTCAAARLRRCAHFKIRKVEIR